MTETPAASESQYETSWGVGRGGHLRAVSALLSGYGANIMVSQLKAPCCKARKGCFTPLAVIKLFSTSTYI